MGAWPERPFGWIWTALEPSIYSIHLYQCYAYILFLNDYTLNQLAFQQAQ
jgi:hypothetical protein